MSYCIVHYAEIATKKANRSFFEQRLVQNIKNKFPGIKASRAYGYFVLESQTDTDWTAVGDIPGISHFFPIVKRMNKDIAEMEKEIVVVAGEYLEKNEVNSFRINTERHDKRFVKNSEEINVILGQQVVDNFHKKVSLKEPEFTLHVKICDDAVYIATQRMPGLGGLPVGTGGQALCLLSGGIDSPVAAFYAIRRGLKTNFIHFKPQMAMAYHGEDKITDLVKELSKFQGYCELNMVDFGPIQNEIIIHIPSKWRMLVFRRFMIRIAEQFSKVLVLGDNISQVASQTIENLDAAYSIADSLLITPLIGLDKKEITAKAREVGTFDISIREYPDCCSFFVPKHPELKASREQLDKLESKLDIPALVKKGVEHTKVIKIR